MDSASIPKLPYFIASDRPFGKFPGDIPVIWSFRITSDFSWEVKATSIKDPSKTASALLSLLEMPEVIALSGSLKDQHGRQLEATPREIFYSINRNYDFSAVPPFESVKRGEKPSVAFTVMAGSQVGGGTIQVYRYANWLTDLGFSVTIYSNDPVYPAWAGLRGSYRCIDSDLERYRSITEDLVFVFSILELPLLLQARNRKQQKIVHFCQGLEEFHFGGKFNQVLASKPFFQLLNSLPIGRVVVSPALAQFFKREYGQAAFYVPNGIDPKFNRDVVEPQLSPVTSSDHRLFRIVQVCNPGQVMKGARITMSAVSLVFQRYATQPLNFHVDFISGPNPSDPIQSLATPAGVSYGIKSGLSAEEMKREYQSCDVVINGSFHEGFGLSSIEAIASGAIVIQADNFGLDGIIEDGINGMVVPRNNATLLGAAIGVLLENPEIRERLRMGGASLGARFSMKAQFNALVETMRRLGECSIDPEVVPQRSQNSETPGVSPAVEVREPPQFSVLVPVYNHAHFLPTTLDTLLAQTYPHWEAVIVNDGSTDSTPAVMRDYAERDKRFKVFHKSNGGTASALNAALERASNEWICWLSSDDFFKPEKLAVHARFIKALPEYRFFHSGFSNFDHDTGVETFPEPPTHALNVPPAVQTLEFCKWNYVHGNTIAIHRSLFQKVGNFSLEYPNAQDFDMWFRMSRLAPFFYINKVTCTTRVHSAAGTVQFPMAGIFDSYRSAITEINNLDFFALVPFARLNSGDGLLNIIQKVCEVSTTRHAFLYQGTLGARSPVLELLYSELLSSTCAESARHVIKDYLSGFAERRRAMGLADGVLDRHLDRFFGPLDETFRFSKIDPMRELTATYEQALRHRHVDAVRELRRYFLKLRRHNIAGVPDLDDIFGPPERYNIDASSFPA